MKLYTNFLNGDNSYFLYLNLCDISFYLNIKSFNFNRKLSANHPDTKYGLGWANYEMGQQFLTH